MNLRFVEAFYWVVMLGSMTRAADKLHLTQSAVSSRIAALESELGTLLIDRRDRKGFRVADGLVLFCGTLPPIADAAGRGVRPAPRMRLEPTHGARRLSHEYAVIALPQVA